jgi:CheY-like chemotaxis protein/HPt (histidine-containing phosphotransfer) domain-containing protein
MIELLSRTVLSATQSHLTKTIRSSAQILLQIVNDLLDLSKIRAGKVALESLPIDLGQVLEECTSLFAGSAESKGIELIVCPPLPCERTLLGDPLRVRQILMNLVGNAVKFTSQGEVVVRADVVAIDEKRATVNISVADTGIGMDAAAINKIFEPFSQADETTTRRFGGTGLGLAICRELADLMGGRISVESRPQIGSTFTLTLTLEAGDAVSTRPAPLLPMRVRILTQRPSLEEALSRHAAALGVSDVVRGGGIGSADDLHVIDASSHAEDMKFLLARAQTSRPKLIVIATAADVEAHDLRVQMDERQIVLKPVHRIAFHEALAGAMGLELDVPAAARSAIADVRLNARILLVEDDAVNAAVAEGYIAAHGCSSVWVKSGADAVARGATERFDLILMDLNMPDMDGFAATQLIRARQSGKQRVPIVALTAHDAATYREKCLRADMDDILSKPYSLEDCTRLLKKWLAGGRESPAPPQAVTGESADAALCSIDNNAVSTLRKLRSDRHADLYSKLVGLFSTTSVDSLAQLRAAFDRRDLGAAAAVCHKLAASAANVGALEYAKRLKRLEKLCVEGDHAQALELHDTLQTAHAPLIDAMLGLTLRASA